MTVTYPLSNKTGVYNMEFLQELSIWTKGDALQGKIMVGIGLILVLCLIFGFKYENPLLKGMFNLPANSGYSGVWKFSYLFQSKTPQYGDRTIPA